MNQRIVRTGLVFVTLLCLCLGRGAVAGISVMDFQEAIHPTQDEKPSATKHFKLKGGGQIDVSTFTLEFSGKASQLGKYTASGTIDPATFQIQGTMTATKNHCAEFNAAKDDSINWVAGFVQGPLGDITATFTFTGGTGHFAGATGSASGPVVLDGSLMFTISLDGTITY